MSARRWAWPLILLPAALLTIACAASITRSSSSGNSSSGGPQWAAAGDRTESAGSRFVCEGQGSSEEEALSAAQGICTDKVCRVCGVEVESVVQTTETLKGVSMQRKVVERCRQFRKQPLAVEHKSIDCSPNGCTAWLEVSFSKEAEKAECAGYASEHFADPNECERLIAEYRNTEGRNAQSFRRRTGLLDQALVACSGIDVRPTPLLDALHEQLQVGMDGFELTPEKQQARLEEPFFDTTWYKSRADMLSRRSATDYWLTSPASLRQQIRETKTLIGRIQRVRDYVYDRSLVFDVVEAAMADDLDTIDGVARLLAALEQAPLGVKYESPSDVHFFPLYRLGELRADLTLINQFYRRSYPASSLYWQQGIPFAHMLAKDGQVDDADWSYIFDLHREHSCVVCLLTLLEVKQHGSPALRDERFFAALEHELKRDRNADERLRSVAELVPRDTDFMLHLRPLLKPELRAALDWDFLIRRLDAAEDADDPELVQQLVPLLMASLSPLPEGKAGERFCLGLADRLARLSKLKAALTPLGEPICGCLQGPLASEGTRVLVNKSDLYDYALSLGLPCVQPG